MKIKQLDVKGFRSLKDARWQPGDLNVVIGQNGTGKSNLMRMLELISEAARGRLSKYIQLAGGIGAILWDGRATSVSFHLKTDSTLAPSASALPSAPLPGSLLSEMANGIQPIPNDYEVELARVGNTGGYQVEREILTDGAFLQKNQDQAFKYIERETTYRAVLGVVNTTWIGKTAAFEHETLLSLFTELIMDKPPWPYLPTAGFRRKLTEMVIYHDIDVTQNSKIRQAAVARLDNRVEPDGQNLVPDCTLFTQGIVSLSVRLTLRCWLRLAPTMKNLFSRRLLISACNSEYDGKPCNVSNRRPISLMALYASYW
jgi:predicted ATPase